MMNLFAITSIPGSRVLKLPMNAGIQQEVEAEFKRQEGAFRAGVEEEHEFDGRYTPGEGELLKIGNFVDVDGLATAIKSPLTIEQFEPNRHSVTNIKAVFSGYVDATGKAIVLIQLFEQRRTLVRGLTLFYSNNTFQKMEHSGLSLDTKLLAILEGDVLKFNSFHFLRRVFEVDDLAREATTEDVQQFMQVAVLAVVDQAAFLAQAESAQIRRKIGFILQSGVLQRHTAPEIQEAARSFGIDIPLDQNNKLVLPNDRAQLRNILRFLDEDYFEAPISRTKFISNSKRVMTP